MIDTSRQWGFRETHPKTTNNFTATGTYTSARVVEPCLIALRKEVRISRILYGFSLKNIESAFGVLSGKSGFAAFMIGVSL
eukprot:14268519-Ditylum_brightwellii.AAC.1